jgi:hypothetical protein
MSLGQGKIDRSPYAAFRSRPAVELRKNRADELIALSPCRHSALFSEFLPNVDSRPRAAGIALKQLADGGGRARRAR